MDKIQGVIQGTRKKNIHITRQQLNCDFTTELIMFTTVISSTQIAYDVMCVQHVIH